MASLSLRFVDAELEGEYQRAAGREGRVGFLISAGASVVLWALAALLLPTALAASSLPVSDVVPLAALMSLVSAAAMVAGRWADTLHRQHALLAVLTSANGLMIMALGALLAFFPGYAVGAIMLLFAFGFVSRTAFVYALLRTAIIAAGFWAVVAAYPANLLLDVIFFVAVSIGSLIGLRMLERSRRSLYYQQRVIAEQSRQLELEKEKSDRLLLNVLPAALVPRLREGETTIADDYPSVTVLFSDIVGFTPLAATRPAKEMVDLLDGVFTTFDRLADERGVEKIKTIGDSYMAAGGLTDPDSDHARRVVDLGLAMQDAVAAHAQEWRGLQLRIGVHTGPAAGGVIGHHKFAFDLWGATINTASRLEQHGLPGHVHISAETWQLVRDEFACQLRGQTELRGIGERQTYLVTGRQALAHSMPTPVGETATEPRSAAAEVPPDVADRAAHAPAPAGHKLGA